MPENLFSVRSQIFVVWWGITIMLIAAVAYGFLLGMLPPAERRPVRG